MDSMQKSLVTNAIFFADQMRKPENADILAAWLGHKPKDDIWTDMYYSDEYRQEQREFEDYMKVPHKALPANVINAEQAARLKAIETLTDDQPEGGHSGFSWAYMQAVAKVILGANRNHMYMGWINQAEEIRAGSTEPLTAENIEYNKHIVSDEGKFYLYNSETKTYDLVNPAEVQ